MGEASLSSVSDYCHWKNSTGNTIVRCFRHAEEREGEGDRREKVQRGKQRARKRDEMGRKRKGMEVRIESVGSVRTGEGGHGGKRRKKRKKR